MVDHWEKKCGRHSNVPPSVSKGCVSVLFTKDTQIAVQNVPAHSFFSIFKSALTVTVQKDQNSFFIKDKNLNKALSCCDDCESDCDTGWMSRTVGVVCAEMTSVVEHHSLAPTGLGCPRPFEARHLTEIWLKID